MTLPPSSSPAELGPSPAPAEEAARLATLRALEILDTEPETAFDRLVGLAADIFGAPIALMTLIDADRQWFKARQGFPIPETSLDISFCAHAIRDDGVCLVPDATRDRRFADNPLVTGEPGIRFYAGAPLTTAAGHRIGTLGVIDTKPRDRFGEAERSILKRLAALVMDEIELREARQRLQRKREGLMRQAAELSAAREEADRSRQRLQDLIDNLPVGVVMTGPDLRVAAHNRSSLELLDLPRELVRVGTPIQDILRHMACSGEFDEDAGPEASVLARLRILRHCRPVRLDRTRPDGTVLEILGRPLPDGGYLTIYLDVSEARRRERDLAAAKEAAEAANRAKTEFLSNISHEIRTPLNGIIGMNALLLGSGLGPEQRHYTTAVRESAEALLALINDLLDIAKLEAGRIELESAGFDPEDMLCGVVEILAPRAVEKGIQIGLAVDPGVPELVCGDPARLRQVLMNLAGNAIKFTERGRVEVRLVPLVWDNDRAMLRFEVRDTGIGMRPEDQGRLFQKFSQADGSITRRFGGTGLGLAISRELVALMGGEIGVESEFGRGSTFWFTVHTKPASADHPPPDAGERAFAGRRALVVGEATADRARLRHLLEREGLVVGEAEDPFATFTALGDAERRDQPFGAAFLDQDLASISGEKFAAGIRRHERFRGVKLVLMHAPGASPPGDGETGVFDAALAQPVRRQALHDVLSGLFEAGGRTAADSANGGPAGPDDAARPPVHARGRVLLAEDNRINRDIVLALLRREGLEADTVSNGAEAVQAVARGDYALVLMDVQMPVLDGLEATRRIRALPGEASRMPIVAMTAHAMNGDRERCLAAGMDDHVAKPLDLATLPAVLRRHLRGGRPSPSAQSHVPADNPHDSPRIDQARLADLKRALSPEDVRSILANWKAEAAATVSEMGPLAERGDIVRLSRLAHGLKGSAGMVGAARLSALAAALEEACSGADPAATQGLTREIATELPNSLRELNENYQPAS